MKVGRLIYLIAGIIIFLGSCKKEAVVTKESIVGKWYIERYTIYKDNSSGYYNGSYIDKVPIENYESTGILEFKKDTTGIYSFDGKVYNFSYSFPGSFVNSNGDKADICKINFDKNQINDLTSPMLSYFYSQNLCYYNITNRTTSNIQLTANFTDVTRYTLGNVSKIDLVLTKME